jgi:transcriptional regulator with XRE-family HTH domain
VKLLGADPKTCAHALAALVADGTLTKGQRGDVRPRVAPQTRPGPRVDPREAARALVAALREGRKARGLTQPQLADLLGVPRTTIGHAETGRLWHSREFWEAAAAEVGGNLVALFDAYLEAESTPPPAGLPPVLAVTVTVSAECVTITWSDGTVHQVRPPAPYFTPGT